MIKKIKTNSGLEEFVMPRTYYGEVNSIYMTNIYATVSGVSSTYTPVDGDQLVLYFNTTYSNASRYPSLIVNNGSGRGLTLNTLGMPGNFYWAKSSTIEVNTGSYYDPSDYAMTIVITTGSCILCTCKNGTWECESSTPQLAGRFFIHEYYVNDMESLQSDNSSFNGVNHPESLSGLKDQQYIYGDINAKISDATCLGIVGWSSSTRYVTLYNYSLAEDDVLHVGLAFMNYGTSTTLTTSANFILYVAYLGQ